MVLETDRTGGRGVGSVGGDFTVTDGAEDGFPMLGHHAVHDHRDVRGIQHLAAFDLGRLENDVEAVPLARGLAALASGGHCP